MTFAATPRSAVSDGACVAAEQSVLGAALLDNLALERAQPLMAGDFVGRGHSAIYSAIRSLTYKGEPADPITVLDALRVAGQASECGGLEYLTELVQTVPSIAHIDRYARVVRESAQRRQQQQSGEAAALLGQFAVTAEQVQTMSETTMIWRDVIASSHIAVWAAPANAGKTTIAKQAAEELAHDGFDVYYLQEDAGAGDLPALFEHAKTSGYRLLNSTLTNSTPEDQIGVLYSIVESNADLSSVVLFFDTLKKFLDLMVKRGARSFFQLMRALTTRGATVVLLGHTNKHRGADGKLIFEGVGDVRNDVDELIYIEASDDGGIVTMTMRPDKVRCAVKEATFQLNKSTMTVRALAQPVDVAAILRRQQQLTEDAELIDVVRGLLRNGGMGKTALIEQTIDRAKVGRRTAMAVINRYMGDDPADTSSLWISTQFRTNNVHHVSLPPARPGAV